MLCGTVAIVTGPQTFFSISEVGSGSDFCIAPFTVNPYFLLGGFQVGTINYGLAGGAPGALGRNWIERADGSRHDMTGTDKADIAPGDVFVVETPGGGGYGRAVEQAAE